MALISPLRMKGYFNLISYQSLVQMHRAFLLRFLQILFSIPYRIFLPVLTVNLFVSFIHFTHSLTLVHFNPIIYSPTLKALFRANYKDFISPFPIRYVHLFVTLVLLLTLLNSGSAVQLSKNRIKQEPFLLKG